MVLSDDLTANTRTLNELHRRIEELNSSINEEARELERQETEDISSTRQQTIMSVSEVQNIFNVMNELYNVSMHSNELNRLLREELESQHRQRLNLLQEEAVAYRQNQDMLRLNLVRAIMTQLSSEQRSALEIAFANLGFSVNSTNDDPVILDN